ncbi:outer membrane lipoprotein-sorting protein [Lutimonas saemankumensis]|uniref:outer membrane lipoprotein-sorting protein n=1 Tax=Lutimonas saemankumensis TaxID=483016 RepID=UPI001CD37C49|nr:outer membrane lipoprotein-sorting protein [Lutimonas saemankumensis]MCA0933343.1 outer membrane lipoprotein-sorting protein [Lutimonas saemankumensis]
MKKISLTLLSLTILFMANASFGQSAASLLKGMDELMSAPKDKEANVKMILTDRSGKQKIREAIMKQKGQYKKLYKYTAPEKQVGIATLSLPDDIIWLYMPAFNKAVKVTLLSKSQAFTGTDFSYEDMSGNSYSERFTPRILESSDDSIYQLELMPKSMKSRYSKIIAYLDKTNLYPLKMEYFDKEKNYFKYATYKYKKQGKYWYAEEVIMKNIKKEHSTEIILTKIKFDQGLEDSEFTVENLKPAK